MEFMSNEEREAMFKARDKLALNELKNDIILGMDKTYSIDKFTDSIGQEPKVPKEPSISLGPDGQVLNVTQDQSVENFTEKAYEDYKNGEDFSGDKAQPLTDSEKIAATEKQLNDLERRFNQIEAAKGDLDTQLKAYAQVLKDPAIIQKAPPIKELMTRFQRFREGAKEKINSLSNNQDSLKEKQVIVDKLEKAC